MRNNIAAHIIHHDDVGLTISRLEQQLRQQEQQQHEPFRLYDLKKELANLERGACRWFKLGRLKEALGLMQAAHNLRLQLAQAEKDEFVSNFIESVRKMARDEQPKAEPEAEAIILPQKAY